MILSRVLPKDKDPIRAKNFAVFTTLSLIVLGSTFPYLLSQIFSLFPTEVPDWVRGLIIGSGAILISWDMVDAMVSSAINAAKNQEIENYEKENPAIVTIFNRQKFEYCCAIPRSSRSMDSVADGNPPQTVCERREGRDAITRGLAYNEGILEKIATTAVVLTLAQLGRTTVSSQDSHNFIHDVYTYLRAWLMITIAHDKPMPVGYITQRYPEECRPDKEAYLKVMENIIHLVETDDEVASCLDPRYRKSAICVMKEYLYELIHLLKKSSR